MSRKIFIPKKCRVGFQHRTDTFTNKLAYVIYYDSLNKIRKERSWQSWCHLPEGHEGGHKEYSQWDNELGNHIKSKGIEPRDFDNEPTSGFVLNKGIRRFNWSHFGSGRSMCRIYDPRGIEFEITLENLVGVLMHTDCSHREIQCELVYAWCGSELMLLPCVSEEYQGAKSYTALQAKKVGARELKEGTTYVTKKEEHLVYIGRHMWFEEKDRYEETTRREGAKAHIFCDLEGTRFRPIKSVPSVIAAIADEHPHDNTANWIDAYLADESSSEIVEWIEEPLDPSEWDKKWDSHDRRECELDAYTKLNGESVYYNVTIRKYNGSSYFRNERHSRTIADLITPVPDGCLVWYRCRIIRPDGSSGYIHHNYGYGRNAGEGQITDKTKFFRLSAKYANGLIKPWSPQ